MTPGEHTWTKILAASLVLGLSPRPAVAAPTEPGELLHPLEPSPDCLKCHAFPNNAAQAADPLVTPAVWTGSMMGLAAIDPVFWAGVAIAHQDAPGDTVDCVRCHAPRAFLAGRGTAISRDALEPDDLGGIDCDFCHRMMDDAPNALGNARYRLDDNLDFDGNVPKRGPWDYADSEPPKHSYLVDPYLGQSQMCGTCHDVTTPQIRVDASGQSLGVAFNEQRTYSEWAHSAMAVPGPEFQSCQDCHMPAVADVAGCGEFNDQDLIHATGGRRHDLAGANRRMVEALKLSHGNAGTGQIDDIFFDIAVENIDRTLADAATLEVTAPDAVDLGQGIAEWGVRVTNQTGHKLPTGYSEGRVMWLEVEGRHGDTLVYSSGRWVDGEGLQDDPQLHTYEAHAAEYGTGVSFHLLRNNTWIVDSRLPPAGMIQDLETDPVGERYAPLPDNTWPHYDDVVYTFPAAEVVDMTPDDPSDDVMTLQVRLLYVINTPQYLQFLIDENRTNTAGQVASDQLAALGPQPPLVLAQWSASVPVTGLIPQTPDPETGDPSDPSTGPDVPTTSGDVPTSSGPNPDTTTASSPTEPQTPDPEASGCACNHSSPSGRGDALAWALLGLVLVRRRVRNTKSHSGLLMP